MSNQIEFMSVDERMDSLIAETKKNAEIAAQEKRQKDRVMILQEKDVVKSLKSMKAESSKKMKNFFKVGIAAGVATLGLATVAPAVAVVVGFAAGYALLKSKKQHKETQSIEKDEKIAKRNVNTIKGNVNTIAEK